MAPPRKHDTDTILDAVRALALRDGPRAVSVAAIARESGAPVGTLYHRFKSRDGLVSAAWKRALERFHAVWLEAAGPAGAGRGDGRVGDHVRAQQPRGRAAPAARCAAVTCSTPTATRRSSTPPSTSRSPAWPAAPTRGRSSASPARSSTSRTPPSAATRRSRTGSRRTWPPPRARCSQPNRVRPLEDRRGDRGHVRAGDVRCGHRVRIGESVRLTHPVRSPA